MIKYYYDFFNYLIIYYKILYYAALFFANRLMIFQVA